MSGATEQRGVVAEFDERRGIGVIAADDGSRHPFHCTRIADGTRTIRPGTRVRFTVVPGHLGHWEASDITPA